MSYVKKTKYQMQLDSFDRALEQDIKAINLSEIGRSSKQIIVQNYDHNTVYEIIIKDNEIISCNCPHHFYRNVICKHMVAVMMQSHIKIAEWLFEQSE